MIILTLLLVGFFIGLGIGGIFLTIKAIHEIGRQAKLTKKANKIVKENKANMIDLSKLKGEERKLAKIKNQQYEAKVKEDVAKEADSLNPSVIAKARFEKEFGHKVGALGSSNAVMKSRRYQELKKEVKLEIKAKKLKG